MVTRSVHSTLNSIGGIQAINQSINQSINQTFNRSIDQSVHRSFNNLTFETSIPEIWTCASFVSPEIFINPGGKEMKQIISSQTGFTAST